MENLKEYDFDIVLLDTDDCNILAHYIWKIMENPQLMLVNVTFIFRGINDNYEKEHQDIMKLYKNDKWLKI